MTRAEQGERDEPRGAASAARTSPDVGHLAAQILHDLPYLLGRDACRAATLWLAPILVSFTQASSTLPRMGKEKAALPAARMPGCARRGHGGARTLDQAVERLWRDEARQDGLLQGDQRRRGAPALAERCADTPQVFGRDTLPSRAPVQTPHARAAGVRAAASA